MISRLLGLDDFWLKITTGLGSFITILSLTIFPFLERKLGPLGPLKILFEIQVVDIIIGTYAAWKGKGKHHPTLKSDIGIKGLNKKCVTWLWIYLLHQADLSFGVNIRDTFVRIYTAFGILSIAEIWVTLKWVGSDLVEKLLILKLKEIKDSLIQAITPKDGAKVKKTK